MIAGFVLVAFSAVCLGMCLGCITTAWVLEVDSLPESLLVAFLALGMGGLVSLGCSLALLLGGAA